MEISNQPSGPKGSSTDKASLSAGATLADRSATSNSTRTIPLAQLPSVFENTVSVEELKLPVGQKILARVIGELKDQNLVAGKDVQLPQAGAPMPVQGDGQARITTPSPNPEGAPRQWLLQLGQQYLLSATSANLSSGNLIEVRILPDQTLAFVTRDALQQPLSNELVTALRKALGQALPQQITFDSGMKELAKFITPQSSEKGVPTPDQSKQTSSLLARSLLYQFNALIPKTELFSYQNSESPPQLTETVKSWLRNSGISLESNIARMESVESKGAALSLSSTEQIVWQVIGKIAMLQPDKREQWLKAAQMLLSESANQAALKNTAQSTNQTGSRSPDTSYRSLEDIIKATVDPKHLSLDARKAISTFDQAVLLINRQITNLEANFRSIINAPELVTNNRLEQSLTQALTTSERALQSALESLKMIIQAADTKTTQSLNAPVSSSTTQQILAAAANALPILKNDSQDLKAWLQKAIQATLLVQERADPQAAKPSPELRGLNENTLLTKPFDFPHLNQSLLKAQAILGDQELSTGQLLKLLAGMLHRITFNQSNGLYQTLTQSEPFIAQSWLMELPYTHANQPHSLQLRIDQHQESEDKDKHGKTRNKKAWTIELSFELEMIGPMHVRAELIPPKIQTSVWVSSQEAKQLVIEEQPLLVDRLRATGLEIETLDCRIGKPEPRQQARIKQGFVDERA